MNQQHLNYEPKRYSIPVVPSLPARIDYSNLNYQDPIQIDRNICYDNCRVAAPIQPAYNFKQMPIINSQYRNYPAQSSVQIDGNLPYGNYYQNIYPTQIPIQENRNLNCYQKYYQSRNYQSPIQIDSKLPYGNYYQNPAVQIPNYNRSSAVPIQPAWPYHNDPYVPYSANYNSRQIPIQPDKYMQRPQAFINSQNYNYMAPPSQIACNVGYENCYQNPPAPIQMPYGNYYQNPAVQIPNYNRSSAVPIQPAWPYHNDPYVPYSPNYNFQQIPIQPDNYMQRPQAFINSQNYNYMAPPSQIACNVGYQNCYQNRPAPIQIPYGNYYQNSAPMQIPIQYDQNQPQSAPINIDGNISYGPSPYQFDSNLGYNDYFQYRNRNDPGAYNLNYTNQNYYPGLNNQQQNFNNIQGEYFLCRACGQGYYYNCDKCQKAYNSDYNN